MKIENDKEKAVLMQRVCLFAHIEEYKNDTHFWALLICKCIEICKNGEIPENSNDKYVNAILDVYNDTFDFSLEA